MSRWLAFVSAALLAGCANVAVQSPADQVFNDRLFAPASERIDASEIFAVSDEMKRYLSGDVLEQLDRKGRPKGLYEALYSNNMLKIEYDSELTRTAAQAFDARSGNCLSLVIMTAAFAKHLGLQVRYQRLFVDDSWVRANDIYFASSHVNITLGKKSNDPRALFAERRPLTIDFMPLAGINQQHAYDLTEQNVVAMFMNNRAAEALSRGKFDDAYWYAREAIIQDPTYVSAYNTLGVVYRRRGHWREAETALRYVLGREPDNLHAVSNLALVYEDTGRLAEARQLEARLKVEPNQPFHYFNLGQEALRQGNYKAARDLFLKEMERDPNYHEFHFWLAASYLGLGDIANARKHLLTARDNSNTRSEHELYAAKLARIRARTP